MKKQLILLAAMILLFSGCIDQKTVGQKTVKLGDNVSVDYTGSLNGNVFDTSIENVAKENDIFIPDREYKPFKFIVGKEQAIKGFEEGIIGMRVGESKTLTIPPEKAYGPKDPELIKTIPIIQDIPIIRSFPKMIDVPIDEFDSVFGSDHKAGDNVQIPESNVNLTIQNMTASDVSLSYNLIVGNEISLSAPWNETVIKIDNENITTKSNAKKNDIFQLKGAAWNTTVIDVDSENITLKHNFVPDVNMRTELGQMKIHFNGTYITMDLNDELAGETLTFNVTVRSID